MKNMFRRLFRILEALIEVAEDKPASCRLSVYEAREKLEAGVISIREYNEVFERQDGL